MEFDNFFLIVIFPPAIVWAILIGISKLFRYDDQKAAIQKFGNVASIFLFGTLFIIFAFVNLLIPLSLLFYLIGGSLIFYSYVIFSAYD